MLLTFILQILSIKAVSPAELKRDSALFPYIPDSAHREYRLRAHPTYLTGMLSILYNKGRKIYYKGK